MLETPARAALPEADPRLALRAELGSVGEYRPTPTVGMIAADLGLPPEAIVKLNANENPFGAPPSVSAALAALDPSRYPDPDARELRAALAAYTGQPIERIVVGNGSDELLELLCRLFVGSGDTIITAPPTFEMYSIASQQHGGRVLEVPRDPDTFDLDTAGVIQAAATLRTRLIFLCDPNNPTGNSLPENDLRAILEAAPCPVIVDEAYADIAGTSALPLLDEYPHLIVLRTLSKLGGLAGLRVGYAVAGPAVTRPFWRIKAPFNVGLAAQAAGVAVLQETEWLATTLAQLRAGRDGLIVGLGTIPGLRVFPSAANYVLMRVAGGQPAAHTIFKGLRAQGILIRRYPAGPLGDCLRISVGTEAQNARVIEEVRRLCPIS
jgi:histidinol-phosphate aminotransferase